MAADYTVKQGDYGFAIRTTLTESADSFDFTAVTGVKFSMTLYGSFAPAINQADAITVSDPAPTETELVAEYVWQAPDLATPGLYNCEWLCEFPGGVRRFASDGYNTVEVVAKLA
jgi:hypothetical protein